MHIGQACSLPRNIEVTDPMFAYRKSKKKDDGTVYPLKISEEKELWRDSASLFMFSGTEDKNRPIVLRQAAEAIELGLGDVYTMKCKVFGLANNKANPLLWRQTAMPVPEGILTDEGLPRLLSNALERVEKTGFSLNSAVKKFAELIIRDEGNADKDMVNNLAKSFGVMARYWASMEVPFFQFLRDLPVTKHAPHSGLEDWQKICSVNARKAFSGFSAAGPETSSRELKAYAKAWVQLQSGLKKLMADFDKEKNNE